MNKFILLNEIIPDLIIDMRYATENNFTGKTIYPTAHCYLVEAAAYALKSAADEFKQHGYTLKIWDAYRPLHVQYIFWEIMPDERYVANPQTGSRHNRGCAVDITLVDKEGKEVNMGTAFDDFSERAHYSYTDLPAEVIRHRKLLRDIMHKHGFMAMETEWWHFDYKEWENYPIHDIPLDKI